MKKRRRNEEIARKKREGRTRRDFEERAVNLQLQSQIHLRDVCLISGRGILVN